jgi:putative inorganic carbon (HCO3(-)) transporter
MICLFVVFVFLRPFISSCAFSFADDVYSFALFLLLTALLSLRISRLKRLQVLNLAPLVFFILSILISFVFSADKRHGFKALLDYIIYTLLFIYVQGLTDSDKKKITYAIICSAIVISVMALYQYFAGFVRLDAYFQTNPPGAFARDYLSRKRVFIPFITPNILAGYLAMILPLVTALKTGTIKIFSFNISRVVLKILIFSLLFSALILTASLSGFLAFIYGITGYLLLNRMTFGNKSPILNQGKRKNAVILLVLTMIISAVIFHFRTEKKDLHTQPAFSAVMRLKYWGQTIEVIRKNPLTGIGLNNFKIKDSLYAHNSYLQLWAETGILGLASFLWLLIAVLSAGITRSRGGLNLPYIVDKSNYSNYEKRKQSIAFSASIIALAAHNLVDFTFFLPEVSVIWWVILGMIF